MKFYAADGTGAINIRCKTDAGTFGAIADEEVYIYEVRLHLSAASAAEDFSTTVDSAINERYDIALDKKAMNALTDYILQPTRPYCLRVGDDLLITKTNAAGLTWSVVVAYE